MKHLSRHEIRVLATYNAEKARGILHSYDWRSAMRKLQVQFNIVQELELCGEPMENDDG